MGYEFMPTGLDSLRYTAGAYAASGKSGGLTAEELEAMGIKVNQPGETDIGLDFTDFLQLMVQQLQNQTIDSTMDSSEMLNQLVQMSVVQMMTTVNDSITALVDASTLNYAASLVGKTVTVGRYNEDNELEEIVGTVTGTGTYQGMMVIFVDGEMYALNSIMAVGTLPEVPEEPGEGDGGDGGTEEGGEGSGEESTPDGV